MWLCLLLVIALTIGSFCGCSNTKETSSTQVESAESDESTALLNTDELSSEQSPPLTISDVELSNTYTTRFGEVNQITAPVFTFDYPAEWEIESEEVTPISETVVLSNGAGVTVTYWNFSGMRELAGPTRGLNDVNVTRVADANFIPGYVQATSYSDLGEFGVTRLETVGTYDVMNGGEYSPVETVQIRYALLPESEIGERQEISRAGLPTFSFYYGGHISLIARSPSGEFTKQEEKEVISILSSFKDVAVSSRPTATPSDTTSTSTITIEELWKKLDGSWELDEYEFLGETFNKDTTPSYSHTMELQYSDKKPVISKEPGDKKHPVIYELSNGGENIYNAYIYKRDQYGSEYGNWSEDVKAVWYCFDLSNLSIGELKVNYYIAFDSGYVDEHKYTYSRG